MCGFAGFFDPTGQIPRDALEPIAREMAATLAHRGPDDGGTWADPDARIALGHRRLSIIDLDGGREVFLSKLIQFFEDSGRAELYNLRSDPAEEHDLSGSMPDQTAAMLRQLESWQQETGAALPRGPNPDYDPRAGRPRGGRRQGAG